MGFDLRRFLAMAWGQRSDNSGLERAFVPFVSPMSIWHMTGAIRKVLVESAKNAACVWRFWGLHILIWRAPVYSHLSKPFQLPKLYNINRSINDKTI